MEMRSAKSVVREWLVHRPKLFAVAEAAQAKFQWAQWRLARPSYPQDQPLRLHLGCGSVDVDGFVNIDTRPRPHVHHVMRVEKLTGFADASVELVYASHCLEHIPHREVAAVISEWSRVLKPGGHIRLSVPDFDLLYAMYAGSGYQIESILGPLMGAQDYPSNFHYTCFTESSLRDILLGAGFLDVARWQHGDGPFRSLPDWSGKCLEWNGRSYPISLNLEARKGGE